MPKIYMPEIHYLLYPWPVPVLSCPRGRCGRLTRGRTAGIHRYRVFLSYVPRARNTPAGHHSPLYSPIHIAHARSNPPLHSTTTTKAAIASVLLQKRVLYLYSSSTLRRHYSLWVVKSRLRKVLTPSLSPFLCIACCTLEFDPSSAKSLLLNAGCWGPLLVPGQSSLLLVDAVAGLDVPLTQSLSAVPQLDSPCLTLASPVPTHVPSVPVQSVPCFLYSTRSSQDEPLSL